MFACKTKFHRHRRKLLCQVLKGALMMIIVSMIATHTLLIKELTNTDLYKQTKQTKGEKFELKQSFSIYELNHHSSLNIFYEVHL